MTCSILLPLTVSVDHIYSIEGVVKGFHKIANKLPSWTLRTPLMQHWQGGLAPQCPSQSTAAFLEIKYLPQTRLWSKILSAHSSLLIAEIYLFHLSLGSFHTSPWLVNIEGILLAIKMRSQNWKRSIGHVSIYVSYF